MESEPPVVGDPASTWLLWCGLPVSAVLLCLAHTPLWLTMPVAVEGRAFAWAVSGQLVALLAVGSPPNGRALRHRLSGAAIVLLLAWAVTNSSLSLYFEGAAIAGVSIGVSAVIGRRLPAASLGFEAAITATTLYCFIA